MSQAVVSVEGTGGDQAAQVSKLIARTMAEFTGRGPVKVRTLIGADDIHVVLQDILTKAEASLVAAGHTQQVLDGRAAIQASLEHGLVAGIQQISGREVIAFLSANHLSPDIAVESFVLGAALDGVTPA